MWFNPILIWLLRSPFHFLVSKNMLLVILRGRKSGKLITIPVNYVQDGRTCLTTSYRSRKWWRNLRGGALVLLRLRGKELEATAEAVEEPSGVTAMLQTYLAQAPQQARYFQVGLDGAGKPIEADVLKAAQERVMIRSILKG